MNIAFIVFLSLFCVTSCVHLYFCFIVNEKLRKITKPFCLAFLSIAVTCLIPEYPLVYCALYIGFVGDIFLLFPKKKITFSFGTVSFFIGHVLYSIQMLISLSYVMPWWFYVIEGVLWVGISLAFIPTIKKQTGKIAYIGNFYMLFLVVALSIGIIFTIDNSNKITCLIPIGYVLFLVSDSLLTITNFRKEIYRKDFYIMLTYLLAEVCIALGLSLAIYIA